MHLACNRSNAPPPYSRFTPICVGNTPNTPAALVEASVHPHVCGEYNATRIWPK